MSPRLLDDVTAVLLAPNPSPMTLDGTNTYLLGVPGSGGVVVVDPGPDLLDHRRAVDEAVGARDANVAAVVVTHHHADHAEAAGWAAQWGAQLHAFSPHLVDAEAAPLRDGEVISAAGVHLEALHTPGHASDHLCLRVAETGAVLTGDHVLGRGTTVVAHPDGDMAAYVSSLERLLAVDAPVLYPGHGSVVDRPREVVSGYLAHRRERERQVLDALAAGDATPAEVVARVYADVDPVLHPAAERSVRAHLDQLVDEERASRIVDPSRAGRDDTYRV
ncbi:MAG: MBL fold metallo-hydrolase [Euzebyales bacterium]|jgi:glyoxylase-like metal-dependent hydrolase (beta-lactamase superfamily II)|nr:MBL fold metallo-hydrolase [Euzebyales bacterium]